METTGQTGQWGPRDLPGSPAVIAFIALVACLLPGPFLTAADMPVQMVVTVEARHGGEVPSLSREDFLVFAGRDRLRVTDAVPLQGEQVAFELFLLIDDASSSSLGSQLEDLRKFIEAQPATTSIGIGYMRNGSFNVVQSFSTDHAHTAQTLRLPLSSAGIMACPWLSLSDLIKRWPGTASRREVVLIASGIDALGGPGPVNPYFDSALDDAQRHGIVVYAVYTPPAGHAGHSFFVLDWGQNHLAQISEETGGEAYMLGFGPPVSFAPYLDEISARLAHQYRVTVLMKAQKKGGFRGVRVATEVQNAELVASKRVYVPASREKPGK